MLCGHPLAQVGCGGDVCPDRATPEATQLVGQALHLATWTCSSAALAGKWGGGQAEKEVQRAGLPSPLTSHVGVGQADAGPWGCSGVEGSGAKGAL